MTSIFDKIDISKLTDMERDFIAASDTATLEYLFGDCTTEEEVKSIIKEITTDEVVCREWVDGSGFRCESVIDHITSVEGTKAEDYILACDANGNSWDFSNCDDIQIIIRNECGYVSKAWVKDTLEANK